MKQNSQYNCTKAAYLFYFFQVPWGVPASIICIKFLKLNENPSTMRKRDGEREISNQGGSSCAGGKRTAMHL